MIVKIIKLAILITPLSILAKSDSWDGFKTGEVVSEIDGYKNRFYYYKTTAKEAQPLVVSLHQWSGDYTTFRNSLAPQAKKKNWNYIHPDFRGPNTHPKACGSDYVVADIDQSIDWAIKNLHVDESHIYIVGASGGGFAALCHFMKSRSDLKIREYSVWVPITDLNRWYHESVSRKSRYVSDIIRCFPDGRGGFESADAKARSPIYLRTPLEKLQATKIKIFAGIHDGYSGAVPITHSIDFFNKILRDAGCDKGHMVSDAELIWMLGVRTPFLNSSASVKIIDRAVHYHKACKNISLTIFEGGHEILVDAVLQEACTLLK